MFRKKGFFLLLLALCWGCGAEEVELVGTVERKNLELAAPVSEEIVEIPVKVGQRVAAGEVVVRLDTEVAELELRAAEALYAAAQATLAAAEREYRRTEGLKQARVASEQVLDDARKGRDEAVGLVAEREARVAQARKKLEDMTVRPTASGVVDQLPFEAGERVPAGGVVAVVLADGAPWVRVWLPARAVARVRPGAEAEVEVEGIRGTLEGRVEDVAREPEFTPHYALTERERQHLVYQSRVVLVGAPEELRPGLPATVRVRLGEARVAAAGGGGGR